MDSQGIHDGKNTDPPEFQMLERFLALRESDPDNGRLRDMIDRYTQLIDENMVFMLQSAHLYISLAPRKIMVPETREKLPRLCEAAAKTLADDAGGGKA